MMTIRIYKIREIKIVLTQKMKQSKKAKTIIKIFQIKIDFYYLHIIKIKIIQLANKNGHNTKLTCKMDQKKISS